MAPNLPLWLKLLEPKICCHNRYTAVLLISTPVIAQCIMTWMCHMLLIYIMCGNVRCSPKMWRKDIKDTSICYT